MNKITPFLWFNDNAEDAAEFYLSVFPEAKKLGELRSSGVGPWPAGKIATIAIELMGQQMTFLNGGSAQALTPARTWVRYGGPDAAPVTTDGPLPETSDLVAGWYMIDVESYERAVELAAYVSSEPGPGGAPLFEWIDVREVMSGTPSDD